MGVACGMFGICWDDHDISAVFQVGRMSNNNITCRDVHVLAESD